MIRFYDYQRRYTAGKAEIIRIIQQQAIKGEYILKSNVEEFEKALSDVVGVSHSVCVSSGTSAMTLALKAYGVGPGDEVITPAFSYIATASAILAVGATPFFVDVSPDSYTLESNELESAIKEPKKACIAAHLFSALADMEGLRKALPAALPLIEDSATAFGASLNGLSAGNMGDLGIFSFFPAKPLGGLGDGGAVLTNNAQIATTVRMLRNHGQDGKTRFHHHLLGYNSRMDEINARWLLERLRENQAELLRKQEIAYCYDRALSQLKPLIKCQTRNTENFSPHAYVIQVPARDELAAYLFARGIETRIHFMQPLPLQPAFAYLGHQPGDFPIAEQLSRETLAIPLHSALCDEEVLTIINAIEGFFI